MVRHPVGGIRTFLRYIFRTFSFQKYSFTLIAPAGTELKILLDDLKDIDVTYIHLDSKLSVLKFFLAVSKEILNGKFDLIYPHGFTSGICSIPSSLLTRTPTILTSHDVFRENQFRGLKGYITTKLLSFMLPMLDIIHSVSHDAQSNLLSYVSRLSKYRNKLVVMLNGIEIEMFSNSPKRELRKELNLSDDTLLIGFLGRFMPQKGFHYLIEALDLMLKIDDLPKKPIILAFGEGGYIREEKEYVKDRDLENSVIFVPLVSNVAPTLKGLDVLAIPSLWEACPLLPMEAMVAGTPIIGSNCIGLREVLKGTPAVMIPMKNSMELAKALIEEIYSPSKSKAMKFRVVAARRFDVKYQAIGLEKTIEGLLGHIKY